MKNILIKVVLSFLLFAVVNSLYGQNQLDNYYYYKGEKVFLDINTQRISISFEGENAINSFESLKSSSNEISEIIEDHTRTIVNAIDTKAKQRKNVKTYYLEDYNKTSLSLKEYLNKIESLKKRRNTLMVSPTYKNKESTEFGLTNNFYVKLKNQNDLGLLYKKAKEFNIEVLGHNEYMPLWFTLSIQKPQNYNALNLANIFYETGLFESTEPAFMYRDLQNSNDPLFGDQWTLKNTGQNGGFSGIDINIEKAWDLSTGNNIKVAVVDQGIELNHPDLITNIFGAGYDAQTNTTPSRLRGKHGVACAGIIGAIKDNNIGIAGVAPNSKLMSISVRFSGTTLLMLANGINWAWQNGADIISNSWGGGSQSSLLDNAINNALSKGRNGLGCVIVFSSGNSNVNGAQYPSNSNPLILSVGAIDRCGVRSGRIDIVPQSCDPWCSNCKAGSSYGTPLDVVAGGTKIPTTDIQGSRGYTATDYTLSFGGTSAACPYVSGVAALVLNINPDLTVKEVNDIIEQSAQKIRTDLYTYSTKGSRSNGTWNNELGYGLVDAYQAVLLAQNSNCPSQLTINQNVSSGQSDIREAKNSITANNVIYNGAIATYNAGNSVVLKTGFHARKDASFRANIEGCVSKNTKIKETKEPELIIAYENIEEDDTSLLEEKEMTKVFPNPVTEILIIKSEEEIASWQLKNQLGKQVTVSNSNKKNFTKDRINISNLNSGFYILTINLSNGKVIYEKIIKN
tara:strand:- start:2766 stop:4985 length:2220 start_codon:yes stop_codon:yes gene_type:complete